MSKLLDALFGTRRGYVAVAYKRGTDWGEKQFDWSTQKADLIAWAAKMSNTGANVFVCPALRSSPSRRKGNGTALRWLWADVDMQSVPNDQRARVEARMAKLGTVLVASGSGENRHVYVKLTREVDVAEHERLNRGLRDFLHADNKFSDEALLRFPGTINHKPEAGGSKVRVVGGTKKPRSPEKLMALDAWKNAKVLGVAEDLGDWQKVDIKPLLKGRIRSLVRMSSDEARSRYGARYRAITAVIGELMKRGFDRDQVHSLMDDMPCAQDKQADEHGAYDLHKDIDRVMSRREVVEEKREEELEADETFSEPEDEPDEVLAELKRRDIRRKADQIEAQRRFMAPPPDVSWTVSDALKNPPERQKHLIKGLAGAKHNVMLIAQYKTGKTTFLTANLIRSLADGTPFLEEFDVSNSPAYVKGQKETNGWMVGHWNCEMDPDELLEEYIRPASMNRPQNFAVANLRGYSVNILSEVGKQWAIDWLKERKCKVWTIDSLARLARMAGVNENDNHEMLNLLMSIDDIKVAAGVDVSFVIAHTGRGEMEDGAERARAATVIDDWPDARWIMTKDGEIRFLAVDGRGVKLKTTTLHFDEDTRRMSLGVGGKVEARAEAGVQGVVDVVTENNGKLNNKTLKTALKEKFPGIRRDSYHTELIQEAVSLGRVVEKPGLRPREKMYWLPDEGRVIDFSKVRDRPISSSRGGKRGGRGAGVDAVKKAGR